MQTLFRLQSVIKALPTGIPVSGPGIDAGGRRLRNLETNYFDTKHYSSPTQYTAAK